MIRPLGFLWIVCLIALFGCGSTHKLVSPINGICSSRKPCYENSHALIEVETIVCACSANTTILIDRKLRKLFYDGGCSLDELYGTFTPRLIAVIDSDHDAIISEKEADDFNTSVTVRVISSEKEDQINGRAFYPYLLPPK